MIIKVDLNEFTPEKGSYVFSASSLDVVNRKNQYFNYHKRILEIIEKGKVKAVLTPLELGKLKNYVSEGKYHKIYSPIWCSKSSIVFYLGGNFSNLKAYSELYKLHLNHNIHLGDLSSVLVAIEYKLPLITDDYHHWSLQQNFHKIYNKRHEEEIANALIEKRKHKIFEMYTSQDFCKMLKC